MEELTKLYDCAHCRASGTCSAGESGASCAYCVSKAELEAKKQYWDVTCATCWGVGKIDSATNSMRHRTPLSRAAVLFATRHFRNSDDEE